MDFSNKIFNYLSSNAQELNQEPQAVTLNSEQIAKNIGLVIALMVGIPLVINIILSFFKIKLTKKIQMYLYAFSCGLIIILGTIGFVGGSIEQMHQFFGEHNLTVGNVFTMIGIVIAAIATAVVIVFGVRWLVLFKNRKKQLHADCHTHDHSHDIVTYGDVDSVKGKWLAIILLSGHKFVEGLSVGLVAGKNDLYAHDQWSFIVIFAVHIIPVTIIIYLTQLNISKNRAKALGYSSLFLLVPVPFIFIGGYLAYGIQSVPLLMPYLFATAGITLTVMAFIELIPEFIDNRKMKTKQWYVSIGLLILGIAIAVILLTVHSH